MAHLTQLGLSGSPDKKAEPKSQGKTLPNLSSEEQNPHSNAMKFSGKQKTAVLIGSLVTTSLLGVFLLESGCSKESDKAATIAAPSETVAGQPPTALSTMPASTLAPIQPPTEKKARQRKLSASTYTNPKYGISFRYPKYGSLKEGDEAGLELNGLGPFEMNFVQPGGTSISAVELPRKRYEGTNFNAAFFEVSVNPKLTSAECEQFAFPETADPKTDPVATLKTKVGATEFHAVEGFAGEENNQADVKYYHLFQNGSCYEFALGLETAADAAPKGAKPTVRSVDRNEVFRKLNWMLSTVKIRPINLPEKPEVAADTPIAPTDTVITEAH